MRHVPCGAFLRALVNWPAAATLALSAAAAAPAFTTNDAAVAYDAYHAAFYEDNNGQAYYTLDNGAGTNPGWWTFAEQIEMAEDAYDNAPSLHRQQVVSSLCHGFMWAHGDRWIYNDYNDDITWAVIAFSRAYLITGNTTFRDVAKVNYDAMFSRAWDTTFTGGGLWWRTDNQFKNAAVNGPAAIAACYLYHLFGDASYLGKAKDCYAWERRVLFNANSTSGAISDGIDINTGYNHWASTYNQGTFIGAAHFLHRITGLPNYYQDAIQAATYTRNSIADRAGILPEYGTGDLAGFHGIFGRWMARFAREQDLWPAYGPWLTANADAAWSVRNADNLAWQKWKTQTPAGTLDSWDCSASLVMLQVANPSPADPLHVTPTAGFTVAAQRSLPPPPTSTQFTLANTGASPLGWSLTSTSAWLSVSATGGTLPAAGSTNATVSVVPSATLHLPAGRYFTSIRLTNLASGSTSRRMFTLVVTGGDGPVEMSGHNATVLAPNHASAGNPGATAFDIPNTYCLYQAGLNDSTRGLPPDGLFTSQLDETTVFQFRAYGSANALVLGNTYPSSGTLTLMEPRAYTSLRILACSANGGGEGALVLNFADRTQSPPFPFHAQDWFATTNNVALHAFGRLKIGSSFYVENNRGDNPKMYQTTIDLVALGITQAVTSILFTEPTGAGSQQTCGIFAVSGRAAYEEPVITQQPSPDSLYRSVGSSATWSVAVDAGLPVNYLWRMDGVPLLSATNHILEFADLQTIDSGDYTVVISNVFGAVTSRVVRLTVAPAPAYPFGQMVMADGAVGYWRLAESSGTVARDDVAGHDGAYTHAVLLAQPGYHLLDTHPAARFGYLAAAGSCVTNIGIDFATSGSAAFSVEAWVNGGAQTTDAGLVTKGYGNGGEQFNLDCGAGGHAFRFFVRDAGGSARVANSSVEPDNRWHHLVGVCDQPNGDVRLYVDGALVGETWIEPNSGILSSASSVSIGSRQAGAGTPYNNQFNGFMQDVAMYDYALSAGQVHAHFQTAENRPPEFEEDPFTVGSANAGQVYSASLVGLASDPNGDPITFSRVSGPAWLTVAGDGSLGGTPFSADVGSNQFVVRATDPSRGSGTATMLLVVVPAPPIVVRGDLQGNEFLLSWVGGIAPYQVQVSTNFNPTAWQDLGVLVGGTNRVVSPLNGASLLRVRGQ